MKKKRTESSCLPHPLHFQGRLYLMPEGRAGQARPSSRVPRKGVSPPSLQNFGQCLQDQDALSHQGHSCGQKVSRPFFGSKPNLTPASADGTTEISGADGLSFRREVRLRRATALPLPNLLLCHWPAPARPSPAPLRSWVPDPLPELPSLRAGSVRVSIAVGSRTRLPLVYSHPLEMGKCPLSS